MKSLLIVLLFTVTVVQCQDSIPNRYLKMVGEIRHKLTKIQTDYELFKQTNQQDNQKTVSLVHQIKENRDALIRVKADINLTLGTLKIYQMVDKMFLEYARILADSYSDALSHIGFEILGFQAGIFQFKKTYVSEAINIEANLMKADIEHLILTMVDIDKRMAVIMNHTNPAGDLVNELKILNELTQTINLSLNMKLRMYELMMRELDVAHQANQEMHILQRTDLDSSISMLNFLTQFIHTYQQLVQRLLGQ